MGNDGIFDGSSFLDDPLTENVDETQTLGVEYLTLSMSTNGQVEKYFIYAKYNKKAYRITLDYNTYKSEKLDLIYEPKGNEGKKTSDGWTILYDNGATAEAVSPGTMGELRIGYAQTTTDQNKQLTESIQSYNNAITIINNYCKSLEGLPNNIGVRSVGARTETTESKYSSNNLSSWNSKYNGIGLSGDMNYEQDLVRMTYWNVNNVGEIYWMASRIVLEGSDFVGFFISYVSGENGNIGFDNGHIWDVQKSGVAKGGSNSRGVRPIITINN